MRHENRAHALLSASSAHRWLVCTPSARLEEQFPDTTSDAAKEGTLAHELAELKLRSYFYTVDFGKRKLNNAIKKLKTQELWNDEMLNYTDDYLDYVKNIALAFDDLPYAALERRVDFKEWVPDGFGTADCILISSNILHVIDFKYGKGVPVSAEQNPQMMLYALGAYGTYRMLYPIKEIRMSIVQPRLTNGNSDFSIPLEKLLEFGDFVKRQAAIATEGRGEFNPGESQCRFCRARQQCRARSDYNVRQAFGGELPPLITNEEVGERLQRLVDVVKYQKDLQEYALKECLAGKEVKGWKAVEGRGSRDWTDMDQAFKKLENSGIDEAMLWERKSLTLAQVEKTVGKKEFGEMVGDMVVKNPGKPALVKETDKRQAITNQISAKDAFQEEK
jgi:hypothetical protein